MLTHNLPVWWLVKCSFELQPSSLRVQQSGVLYNASFLDVLLVASNRVGVIS